MARGAKKVQVEDVPLELKDIEMSIYGLKIWRQVMVSETFAEFRNGRAGSCQETIVDIDLALEKLEKARGKFHA